MEICILCYNLVCLGALVQMFIKGALCSLSEQEKKNHQFDFTGSPFGEPVAEWVVSMMLSITVASDAAGSYAFCRH